MCQNAEIFLKFLKKIGRLYCAQPHKEVCRFEAAAFATLTADFIGREYNNGDGAK
ncbi:hypothetical protein AALC75_22975 [Lachnospiraceae bacterium 48-42]